MSNALQSTTLAAQTIVAPLAVATYTALADCELLVHVYLSGLAGNGNYRACLTKRRGGTGTIFQGATAAIPVASGVTTVWMETLSLPVVVSDVVTVWVQGLAGDTSVGIVTDVFDLSANVTLASGAITAAVVATGAIDADALAADAVDEILDEIVEGTLTLRQVLRIVLAALAGKASGGGTTTITFRDVADAKSRLSMVVSSAGDRSAVTLDGS